jgi:hypothetical protein
MLRQRGESRLLVAPILLLWCALNALGGVITATPLQAQTVRGTVRDRATGAPVKGALILLATVADSALTQVDIRRTATDERGVFSVRAASSGVFRLTVQSIGSHPHVALLTLADDSISVVEVALDRIHTLAAVAVAGSTPCVARGGSGLRVANLWYAARTALSLTLVAAPSISTGARLVRFRRTLRPHDLAILQESVNSYDEHDGITPLYRSQSGEALSRDGYWRRTGALTMEFFAPDAEALLSDAFLRDHCFNTIERSTKQPGLVGLTFEPVGGRQAAGIRGTMWLDETTTELRFLDFSWLGLPPVSRHEAVGGRVHYASLSNGAWIVCRWSLVMPQPGSRVASSTRDRESGYLYEEGGLVVTHGSGDSTPRGAVRGRVVRASGAPMRWAIVRLVGTSFFATVDSGGRFSFDSVPAGAHAIVVQHPEFDKLGVRVAEIAFVLDEGAEREFPFRAPSELSVLSQACQGRAERSGALRVTLRTPRTVAIENRVLRLTWQQLTSATVDRATVERMTDEQIEITTDASGSALFCSVPPSRNVSLSLVDNDEVRVLQTVKLEPNQFRYVLIDLTTPPRG